MSIGFSLYAYMLVQMQRPHYVTVRFLHFYNSSGSFGVGGVFPRMVHGSGAGKAGRHPLLKLLLTCRFTVVSPSRSVGCITTVLNR